MNFCTQNKVTSNSSACNEHTDYIRTDRTKLSGTILIKCDGLCLGIHNKRNRHKYQAIQHF